MAKLQAGPAFAVFVIFFGAALMEAIRNNAWGWAGVYVALGLLSLRFAGIGAGNRSRV